MKTFRILFFIITITLFSLTKSLFPTSTIIRNFELSLSPKESKQFIAQYTTHSPSDTMDTDSEWIRIGVFDETNTLLYPIFKKESHSFDGQSIDINEIALQDLNNDGLMDFIITLEEANDSGKSILLSYFAIRSSDKTVIQLYKPFEKSQYEFKNSTTLKVKQALNQFGGPYSDASESTDFWIDFYEFKGTRLVEINRKHKDYYQNLLIDSNKKLKKLLKKIEKFRFSAQDPTKSQLELNNMFTKLSNLKLIIAKTKSVLSTQK